MNLPQSLVIFLETLGIAVQPTAGNFDYRDREPDF